MVRRSRSIYYKLTFVILLVAFFLAGPWVQAATIVEYVTPIPDSQPNSLTLDSEGNVCFTEMGHYFMGKYHSKIGKLIP